MNVTPKIISTHQGETFKNWEFLKFVFTKQHQKNPYTMYAKMRETGSVLHSPASVTFFPRYETVDFVCKSNNFLNTRQTIDLSYRTGKDGTGIISEALFRFLLNRQRNAEGPFEELAQHFLTQLDPPEHTRQRKLVARAFTQNIANEWRPEIEKIAHELLDQIQIYDSTDLLQSYAYQIPIRVICTMMGVPLEDFSVFDDLIQALMKKFDQFFLTPKKVTQNIDSATETFRIYLRDLADKKRKEPKNDLLSKFVEVHDDGDELTENELLAVVVLVLGAGHETTANLIGNSVWSLHNNPAQRDLWITDPSIRPNAINELLRYESPIQTIRRTVAEDMEIDGVFLAKGRTVLPMIGSANWDPEKFPEPEKLLLQRNDAKSLAFGNGAHLCVGAALARMEAEIALGILYDRLPKLRPIEDAPQWRKSAIFRGLKTLPVRWD